MDKEARPRQLNINPNEELFFQLHTWVLAEDLSVAQLSRRLLASCVEQQFENNPGLLLAYDALMRSRAEKNP